MNKNIVGRRVLTPPPPPHPHITYPSAFFQILWPPPSPSHPLSPLTFTPSASCSLVSFTEWVITSLWCVILLMILWIYGSTHVKPWYLSARRTFTEVWHIIWLFASLWFDITDTKIKTHYTQGPIDWHTHTQAHTHIHTHVSQQLCVLHWMNNSLILNISFPECLCFNKKLFTCRSHIC